MHSTKVSHSIVVGTAQHYSVLKEIFDDHFQFVVYKTSNTLDAYMCSKGIYLLLKNGK